MAQVLDINISHRKGTIKKPITMGLFLENHGLEGDAHAGPWHRQVSLLAVESIDIMRKNASIDLDNGVFAENITTQGIELHTLPVGTILQIGATIHEVTQIGKECHTGCEIQTKVGSCIMPTQGIFTRILKTGHIYPGDQITILEDYQSV
ncbi:MAG: MOSC domain-containing protein [Bacilli bacterium]